MDRLHVVIIAAALAAGCSKEGGDGKAEPAADDGEGRVNAVQTVKKREVTVDEFCDVLPKGGAAPALAMPPLAAGQSPPPAGKWRWLNVWATWCKPCIEEMPLLTAWQKTLTAEGKAFDLVFLSADENDQLVADFRKKHPATPESLRIDKPEALIPWLVAIGLGEGAPIPVHVLVDPADKVRCVRAGGVKESDLPAVRSLLAPG
jgi:thiol-disulfide isomerase/thioredoxin